MPLPELAVPEGLGFEGKGAGLWIDHVENSGDAFRERALLYPFIREWSRRMGLDSCHHVLDVCCGQGDPTAVLMAESGAYVTGIDTSEPLIARARTLYGNDPKMQFLVGDAADLFGWPQNCFHAATCINGLPHLSPEDMVTFFKGLKWVVRPSGPILVTSVNPDVYEEFADAFQDQTRILIPPPPQLSLETDLVIGYPLVAGSGGEEIRLEKSPFYMHPLGNIFTSVAEAGLDLGYWPPRKLASLKLVDGEDKDLLVAYELLA